MWLVPSKSYVRGGVVPAELGQAFVREDKVIQISRQSQVAAEPSKKCQSQRSRASHNAALTGGAEQVTGRREKMTRQ